jgi:hypothetical protein
MDFVRSFIIPGGGCRHRLEVHTSAPSALLFNSQARCSKAKKDATLLWRSVPLLTSYISICPSGKRYEKRYERFNCLETTASLEKVRALPKRVYTKSTLKASEEIRIQEAEPP